MIHAAMTVYIYIYAYIDRTGDADGSLRSSEPYGDCEFDPDALATLQRYRVLVERRPEEIRNYDYGLGKYPPQNST